MLKYIRCYYLCNPIKTTEAKQVTDSKQDVETEEAIEKLTPLNLWDPHRDSVMKPRCSWKAY